MAAALATTNDSRSRLHRTDAGLAARCGAQVTRMATAEDGHKRVCFFCESAPAPAAVTVPAPRTEEVTIRVAEVLVPQLAAHPEFGAEFTDAATTAEIRRAGRGATYHITTSRRVGSQVAAFLAERLTHKRMGLGIQRWRVERAYRMVAADLDA